jgi:hypothetical protein
MKLKSALFTAFVALTVSMPAMAQDNGGSGGQGDGQQFQARKQQILDKLHAMETCVQAANSPQDLRACRPAHGQGGQDSSGGNQ